MVSARQANDVILTGIPRSGTTLTCHLLNQVPDTVALHEPMNPQVLVGRDDRVKMERIAAFFSAQRASLLASGTARGKSVRGRSTHNSFDRERVAEGLRQSNIDTFIVRIDKPLGADFMLAMKHPNAFTALLELLVQRFRCFAVIRNPLGVLGSWNSVAVPVRDGRAPFAEAFDARLARALEAEPDRHARQLILLSWYYEQYRRHLRDAHILRYENIVVSRGRELARITAGAAQLDQELENQNRSELYDSDLVRGLAGRLLDTDGAWWQFYTRSDVERMIPA
jgi:hypothetical protein